MERNFSTDLFGKTFDQATIDKVWEKGKTIDGVNPMYVRRDICGSSIAKGDYGKQEKFGWEIDHIDPVANEGADDISNLQPLQWENNRRKADNYPWKC
jgi:hypothetical protein